MNIHVWWCHNMKLWRWTITQTNRPIINQQSGQGADLSEIMNIIQIKVKEENK